MNVKDLIKTSWTADDLRKLLMSNWTLPKVETIFPWFVAFLSGLIVAVTSNFAVAFLTMPKPTIAKNAAGGDFSGGQLQVPKSPALNEFEHVISRNIFNSEGILADSSKNANGCQLKKSELPLKYIGVIFGGSALASLVVLESTGEKKADTFLMGEMVPGEAQVVNIEPARVYFLKNGCQEYLDLEEPPSPKRRVAGQKPVEKIKTGFGAMGDDSYKEEGFERRGTSVQLARQWLDKAITLDLGKTLQDAKANPNMVGNEIKGWVLTKIRPDSVYEKMGIQEGDVIESINGIELTDAIRAVQTLKALQGEANLELAMKRGNQSINFKVQVK